VSLLWDYNQLSSTRNVAVAGGNTKIDLKRMSCSTIFHTAVPGLSMVYLSPFCTSNTQTRTLLPITAVTATIWLRTTIPVWQTRLFRTYSINSLPQGRSLVKAHSDLYNYGPIGQAGLTHRGILHCSMSRWVHRPSSSCWTFQLSRMSRMQSSSMALLASSSSLRITNSSQPNSQA
jgi:hypothetical protein